MTYDDKALEAAALALGGALGWTQTQLSANGTAVVEIVLTAYLSQRRVTEPVFVCGKHHLAPYATAEEHCPVCQREEAGTVEVPREDNEGGNLVGVVYSGPEGIYTVDIDTLQALKGGKGGG